MPENGSRQPAAGQPAPAPSLPRPEPGHEILSRITWRGYGFVMACIALYVSLYVICEARHERRAQLAALERNMFFTLVSAGERDLLVTALQNFGPVQRLTIPQPPLFWQPWRWGQTMQPNMPPLWRWARRYLSACVIARCGFINPDIVDPDFDYRLDLREADLAGTVLRGVDFTRATLARANVAQADMREAIFERAYLYQANFRGANLSGATVVDADLSQADFSNATWIDGTRCAPGSLGGCWR